MLSGILLFASFPKLDWVAVVWFSGVPLLAALITEKRILRGFLYGAVMGVVFLAGSCYWVVSVLEVYGNLDAALSVPGLLAFVLLFVPLFGCYGALVTAVSRRSASLGLLLSPFLWIALELGRTYYLTGFPWNLLGYAVRAPGLQQIATVTAVYGLSFIVAVTWAILTGAILAPRKWVRWVALSVWAGALFVANARLYPPKHLPEGPATAILVQPDVPLKGQKFNAWIPWENPKKLDILVSLSTVAAMNSHLASPPWIVWPEDPAPFYFDRDPIFRGAIEAMAQKAGSYVIAGTVTFRGSGINAPPRNSAVVLNPQGKLLMRYDKMHLVPFGEYVPWWGFPGSIGKITNQAGDFIPGRKLKVASTSEGKAGVFICYEAIFPQQVRRFAHAGAQVLVNISDDAWYGTSSARYQHLEMARFRAIENRRYLLRDTNNGITAVIDPYGRIVAQAAPFCEVALTAHFAFETRETFYTRYGDVFAWFATLMAVAIAAFGLAGARRAPVQAPDDSKDTL